MAYGSGFKICLGVVVWAITIWSKFSALTVVWQKRNGHETWLKTTIFSKQNVHVYICAITIVFLPRWGTDKVVILISELKVNEITIHYYSPTLVGTEKHSIGEAWKTELRHLRTGKTEINMRMRAVWSKCSLFANIININSKKKWRHWSACEAA